MLDTPPLDDRDFNALLADAWRRVREVCPEWTDLSPSDPGAALIEAFAFLTETLLFRHNRLPARAYVEFLRLIGARLDPPSAATAELVFTLAAPATAPVQVPRGTMVTIAAAGEAASPPVFVTATAATIEAGGTAARVPAHDAEPVEAELLGVSSGQPGQSFTLRRPPVVAPLAGADTLLVGVATLAAEIAPGVPRLEHGGRAFRLWREVGSFADVGDDPFAFMADRLAGRIIFAPSLRGATGQPEALAAVPAVGRELRAWYRRAGGERGNVAAGTLTVPRSPLPGGLTVTNPERAAGGREAETLDHALVRGPREFLAQERAVTARDVEALASRVGGIARARAATAAALWRHARPGTVQLALVPDVPASLRPDGRLPVALLAEHERPEVLAEAQAELDRRRPLGTRLEAAWARYKPVRVEARVRLQREEDPEAAKARILRRLHTAISPLPLLPGAPAWRFGAPLTAWDVYGLIRQEPGVVDLADLRLCLDAVPEADVTALAADLYEPATWYAGRAGTVFRSRDDGEGWEPVGQFAGERVVRLLAQPALLRDAATWAGHLAVITELPGNGAVASKVYHSTDCGESWTEGLRMAFKVFDLDWVLREGRPALVLATDLGLYELAGLGEAGSAPVQLVVDPADPKLGFYAVAAAPNPRSNAGLTVAVAARDEKGVFLSASYGASAGARDGAGGSFKPVGLKGELVRVLYAATRGGVVQLWAGLAAAGADPGKGVFRWEVTGAEDSPTGWRAFAQGWGFGSCYGLAVNAGGDALLAATQRGGVVRLALDAATPAWAGADVGCGLPLRDVGRLKPVLAVAGLPSLPTVMAGGEFGVYRSRDGGRTFALASAACQRERVTIPPTWLLASGEHLVEIVDGGGDGPGGA